MVERRLNAIKTDADVMMAVGPFNNLMQRLESMKISLMKLQQQLGLVLGKNELRLLAIDVADILSDELDDVDRKEERIDRIIEKLFIAIENAGGKEEENE